MNKSISAAAFGIALLPVIAFVLLSSLSTFSIAHAQAVCPGGCQTGYSCITDPNINNGAPTCKQNPSDPQEIAVTAPSTAAPATTPSTSGTFATIVQTIISIFDNYVIPLLYAFAFIFFVAGLVRYFFIGQGEEAQEKGKQMAIYGLIGLVVLFGVWGIVNVVLSTITSVAGISGS
jgi:hypothetical protein